MIRFVLRRLPVALLVIVAGSLLAFLIPRLTPGDPAAAMVGQGAPIEVYQAVRTQLGLDLPLHQQYLTWIANLLRGDLGQSYLLRQPVSELVTQRLGATLELALAGFAIMLVAGFTLASHAALSSNPWIVRGVEATTGLALAIPAFLVGVILIVLFGIVWPVLPVSGTVTLRDDFVSGLQYLVLPAVTVAFAPTAVFARLVQNQMASVKGEEFVRTAIAKGLAKQRIDRWHIRRNSLAPAVVVSGVIFSELLGGAVIVENIFAREGLGSLAVSAVANRDYMVVQVLVLMSIVIATLVQLAAEVIQALLDPRLVAADAAS
jgi:peptide/nickel transport system permease protein